ncbi:MAG: metal-sulfur cluster biosynthetic enzyme/nitrite reductase/ring-hydroxylating ferredoxin subunit [Porticoccaceae bacterium]|jgi:metal-sulfur cluster biosynthetic enzyme/nitrite reductase/ring-hydroxylating ferredoxin subunit
MDTTMSDYEQVASVSEIEPGQRLSVFVDDIPVLLIQQDDGCYAAVEDVCSHDGQPLTDGPIENGAITCDRHGASFDLKTGKPTCMPATEGIQIYDVKIEEDSIYLRPSSGEVSSCNHPTPANTVLAAPTTPQTIPTDGEAAPLESIEVSSEDDENKSIDEKMIDALRTVIDPELMINIVDLGLVYSVNHDGKNAYIDMTLTSPACPAGPQIVQQAKMSLERLHLVEEAEIKLVMTPPWSPERMTDEARDHLGIF